MDTPIENKKWSSKHIAMVLGVVAFVVLAYFSFFKGSGSNLTVDGSRVSTALVSMGEFKEYVPINGTVQPLTTVYLDLQEGGIVERIYIDGGSPVKAGDLLVKLSNTTLQKQNIDSETRLLENLDRLRNSEITSTEKTLLLKEQLIDLDYQILTLEKRYERFQSMWSESSEVLSKEEFEGVEDNLEYLRDKRDLLRTRIEQESQLREDQSSQISKSMRLVNRSLDVLTTIIDSLDIRAPIDGYLSSMNAEIGQSFNRGARIGQIDQLDRFKVQADVDQFYISQVQIGQTGTFSFNGQDYELVVKKIYPEVEDDTFLIDLEFANTSVPGIKRGQTLQIDLQLSESNTSRMVKKGGYFRHTNGRWVYRVSEDGMSAERVNIVSGRQNPKFFEILDGLEVGDRIVASNYDSFGGVDSLQFSQPVK